MLKKKLWVHQRSGAEGMDNGLEAAAEIGKPSSLFVARETQRPLAVIECWEEIPCNPCEVSCPQNAIHIGKDITAAPSLDVGKCVGCGLCIARCPGLAIFVVDFGYSDDNAAMSFPYEYLPVPRIDESVVAVDADGREVCEAKVLRVSNSGANDRTPVVTIAVAKQSAMAVRSFARRGGSDER